MTKNGLRLWALANLVVLLVAVLPGALDHPYPALIRPYVQWSGILFYVVSGLCFVVVAGRKE
ncbi:MAG: hypothetical protein LAO77_14330 [Acidobacteriia bacterium]|nr:hypothetical protein [Terriglobia bacterium]